MSSDNPEQRPNPTSAEPPAAVRTVESWCVSVSFWFVLLVAAAMYAAVALSPKLAGWINAHQQYAGNGARLAELEDEADYLERFTAALKRDPAFAVQLVDAAQGPRRHETEVVGLSGEMAAAEPSTNSGTMPSALQRQLAGLIFYLASHEQHRTWMLIGSCGLTLLSFSLLNESGAGLVLSMSCIAFLR